MKSRGALIGLLLGAAACAPPVPVPLTPAPPPDEIDVVPEAVSVAPVWTVRLHADEDPGRAEDIASQARGRLDVPVTIVHEGGEYRVHAGAFGLRDEADAYLRIAQERGFRDATVTRRDPVEPPPAPKGEEPPQGP